MDAFACCWLQPASRLLSFWGHWSPAPPPSAAQMSAVKLREDNVERHLGRTHDNIRRGRAQATARTVRRELLGRRGDDGRGDDGSRANTTGTAAITMRTMVRPL